MDFGAAEIPRARRSRKAVHSKSVAILPRQSKQSDSSGLAGIAAAGHPH